MDRRTVLAGMAAGLAAWRSGAAWAQAIDLTPVAARVVRLSPGLDRIMAPDASPAIIATGIQWAEGPVWVPAERALLFSDPPANLMRRWTRDAGGRSSLAVFLNPSGAGGTDPKLVREPGSNGLGLDHQGRLLIANSGGRSLDRMTLPGRGRTVLASRYEGKRFNSPNDLTLARSGAVYFTDPPYGLADGDQSSIKELPHNGVYRWTPDGKVALVDGELTRPNGVALSPDERRLYVSVSDEKAPRIMVYDLDERGRPRDRRLFLDPKAHGMSGPGLPDGMKVAGNGTLFCSSPGGMYILTPEGEPLGRIEQPGSPIANCAFGEDGATLFLTANHQVLRLPLRINGWRA